MPDVKNLIGGVPNQRAATIEGLVADVSASACVTGPVCDHAVRVYV